LARGTVALASLSNLEILQKAAEQGHINAQYNLAVAHMKEETKLPKGAAKAFVENAAKQGHEKAKHVKKHVCDQKNKYCD
jgi:TPR repeat protein